MSLSEDDDSVGELVIDDRSDISEFSKLRSDNAILTIFRNFADADTLRSSESKIFRS
jgi:hypothetical protein